ncbi:unnamed protein product [Arabidopsis halleri]
MRRRLCKLHVSSAHPYCSDTFLKLYLFPGPISWLSIIFFVFNPLFVPFVTLKYQ